ncbi:hypothetical protein F3J23_07110 [Chryseobacterium sp. Tr-659]|nr:hypothetical protein [Chryseobacterium sp. Tr-659]
MRNISIVSYLLIVLVGQIIGLPFIIWLLFTAFDFGNIDQVFAVLGILGIVLNFTKWKNKILITILSLLMMLSPLASRMIQVPIEQFNYLAFQIPFLLFIFCYLIFIILNVIKRKRVVSL